MSEERVDDLDDRPTGKGRPTPKRREAQRRRPAVVSPPPKNRREAYKRTRESQREGRAERRAAMARGDEKALLPRDRGPVRRHVRDLVDSRHHVLSFFLPSAVVLFIGTLVPIPAVSSAAVTIWFLSLVLMIGDGLRLARTAVTAARTAFPDHDERGRSIGWYAAQRASLPRRFRTPRPQVDARPWFVKG